MNTKFHTGGYLFWGGWFFSCIYFFFARVKPKPLSLAEDEPKLTNSKENNLEL